jgi:MATE family multidrug resistance protein
VASELAGLLLLAAPIAAAQAGLALMGIIDTAVVGRAGAAPLAGVGLGNGIFFALALVGLGAMMGFDPLFSQAVGAGEPARARATLRQAGWLALLLTPAIGLPIAAAPLLLERAGVPAEIAREASAFLWWRLPSLLPMYLFAALRSYLQAKGRTRALVASTVVANVANLALDVVLVFGLGPLPALGASGAGIATSLSQAIQLLVLAWDLPPAGVAAGKEAGVPPQPAARGIDRATLAAAFRVGLPFGVQMGVETGIFALVGLLAARLGKEQMAAHQVAISLASFTFCFAVGIGSAGGVRVGWSVGARDARGVRLRGLLALGAGGAIMSLSALLFWLAPGPLARLLSDQPEILRAAAPLLFVAAVFQIADGLQGVGAGVLRGAGDTRFSLAANLVGHWGVGLPLALWLGYGRGLGVVGLWWGLCAGLSSVAVALVGRFLFLSARVVRPIRPASA